MISSRAKSNFEYARASDERELFPFQFDKVEDSYFRRNQNRWKPVLRLRERKISEQPRDMSERKARIRNDEEEIIDWCVRTKKRTLRDLVIFRRVRLTSAPTLCASSVGRVHMF